MYCLVIFPRHFDVAFAIQVAPVGVCRMETVPHDTLDTAFEFVWGKNQRRIRVKGFMKAITAHGPFFEGPR